MSISILARVVFLYIFFVSPFFALSWIELGLATSLRGLVILHVICFFIMVIVWVHEEPKKSNRYRGENFYDKH